jgi:hypothetical protein
LIVVVGQGGPMSAGSEESFSRLRFATPHRAGCRWMFSNGNSDTYRQDNTAGYNRIGPQSPAHAAHLCKECEDSTISRSNKLFFLLTVTRSASPLYLSRCFDRSCASGSFGQILAKIQCLQKYYAAIRLPINCAPFI